MKLPDPYKSEKAVKWKIIDGNDIREDRQLAADVLIIGSGAGGGLAAEIFSRAGRRVILIEEGGLRTSSSFNLNEIDAYKELYQEGMTRVTKDGSISILQGRTVGGSTTVNWTSSFRTPHQTLEYWNANWGTKSLTVESLKPWFEIMERRLSIQEWPSANANNDVIRRGCEALALSWHHIKRNVNGCWNLGYCGLGCPTNAKQSMLVTTIPSALEHGAILIHRLHARRLIVEKNRATGVEANVTNGSGAIVRIKAPIVILSAGAIGSPSLLLRSEQIPNPYQRTGKRTFLHPSVFSFGQMPTEVAGYHGAPQSIYSDHFLWEGGTSGPMGYKIETVPMHPAFASGVIRGRSQNYRQKMKHLASTNGILLLLRDGFHEDSPGGSIELRDDGTPTVNYPITPYLMDGAKRAYLTAAEIMFAAGAQGIHVGHFDSPVYKSWNEAKRGISELEYKPLMLRIGCAHVMGGCAMGSDPENSVVNENGQHHQIENLYVCDGSLFPTSLGANPQLSIYGLVARITHKIIGGDELYFDREYLPGTTQTKDDIK